MQTDLLLIPIFIVACFVFLAMIPIILMLPVTVCEIFYRGDQKMMRVDMEFHRLGYS